MSWHERPYSRYGGGRFADNPLTWAPHVGTVAGIRVRVHMLFLLYIAMELLNAQGGILWLAHFFCILFGSVLLHEFGHCFAARSVGGTADEVLLWPLGGLAFVDAPRAPWPQFVTVVWGPLVNVGLFSVAFLLMWLGPWRDGMWEFNPFYYRPFSHPWSNPRAWINGIYLVNLSLFLFNLWPMYPMDAGRMLHCALWARGSHRRATLITTSVGMVAAILMGLWGMVSGPRLLLLSIAILGYIECMQTRQMARAEYDDELYGHELIGASAPRRREGWLARWRRRRSETRRRRQAEFEAMQATEVDRILAKVHEHGIQSLTRAEKRTLEEATRRERDRAGSGRG